MVANTQFGIIGIRISFNGHGVGQEKSCPRYIVVNRSQPGVHSHVEQTWGEWAPLCCSSTDFEGWRPALIEDQLACWADETGR